MLTSAYHVDMKQHRGFTLIEVVIVLAIAALIIAGVLIAVSGAQRARRDNERKRDMSLVESYMQQYAANHGHYPSEAELPTFRQQYITDNHLYDPSKGQPYEIVLSKAGYDPDPSHCQNGYKEAIWKGYISPITLQYDVVGANPDGSPRFQAGTNFTMTMKLESGDDFCIYHN